MWFSAFKIALQAGSKIYANKPNDKKIKKKLWMKIAKKLFNYQYSDSMGKSNGYTTETAKLKTLLESVKDKDLLGE